MMLDPVRRSAVRLDRRSGHNLPLLTPARLVELAAELDAAGAACEVLAGRTFNRGSRVRHMARATLCYSAARLLRRIAA